MKTSTHKEEHLGKLIDEDDFLGKYVTWALWLLAVIVVVATVTGQVESYNGLYNWFASHHVTGFWADFAPLTVDSFTVIGELAIFAGISRHWPWTGRVLPWCSAIIGIVSSVAANVGDKVQYHSIPTDLTAAIFPLAGAFGIVIGLGVLKRVAKDFMDKRAEKKDVTVSPDEVALQLSPAENHVFEGGTVGWEPVAGPSMETMTRISNELADRERKGMDVLIPPRPPVEVPWEVIVQPTTQPTPAVSAAVQATVSREEARRRLTDLKPGRPIIQPDGLSPYQTGAQPFTAEDVLNYKKS